MAIVTRRFPSPLRMFARETNVHYSIREFLAESMASKFGSASMSMNRLIIICKYTSPFQVMTWVMSTMQARLLL